MIDPVNLRLLPLLMVALTAGCTKLGTIDNGGIYVARSTCPQLGIVAGTGDVTLFDPPGSNASAAIDVVATMTNLRQSCSDSGPNVVSTATFDVVAIRRDPSQPRQVVLPFFNVIQRGGDKIESKRVGAVQLNFAAGSLRAQTSSRVSATVNRDATRLPEDIARELAKPRFGGQKESAIDPLSDPKIRDALSRATFEHLIGFQLTQDQLRYNATR